MRGLADGSEVRSRAQDVDWRSSRLIGCTTNDIRQYIVLESTIYI